jgi:hypothetical protein
MHKKSRYWILHHWHSCQVKIVEVLKKKLIIPGKSALEYFGVFEIKYRGRAK